MRSLSLGSVIAVIAIGLAGVVFAAEAGGSPQTYEAVFAPLRSAEKNYAILGPAGPFYPSAAIKAHAGTVIQGEALLECRAKSPGVLDRCSVVSSSPLQDFGLAARALSRQGRLSVAGGPLEGQLLRVHVPFDTSMPVEVGP